MGLELRKLIGHLEMISNKFIVFLEVRRTHKQHLIQISDGRWSPRLEARRQVTDMKYSYFLSVNMLFFEMKTDA